MRLAKNMESVVCQPLRVDVLFPSNLLFSAHANSNTGVKNDRYRLVTRVIEYQRMNKPSMVEITLSASLSGRLLVK